MIYNGMMDHGFIQCDFHHQRMASIIAAAERKPHTCIFLLCPIVIIIIFYNALQKLSFRITTFVHFFSPLIINIIVHSIIIYGGLCVASAPRDKTIPRHRKKGPSSY